MVEKEYSCLLPESNRLIPFFGAQWEKHMEDPNHLSMCTILGFCREKEPRGCLCLYLYVHFCICLYFLIVIMRPEKSEDPLSASWRLQKAGVLFAALRAQGLQEPMV